MSSIRHLNAAVLALAVCAGIAAAQTDGPAEFPPADFNGNQFVDSNGCAFIRAGIGGATNWVPRVSRQRQPLCNFQPSFAAGTAGPAPGPVAPLDAPIIEITPPVATAAAAAPAPTPTRTRSVSAPIQTVASIPARRPAPAVAPAPAATPQIITPPPAPEPPRVTLAEACEGRFGIQPGFVSARTGDPIDCGPAPQTQVASAPAAAAVAPEPLRMTLAEVCAEVAISGTRFVRPDGSPIICDAPAPAPAVVATASVPAAAPAPVAAPVASGSICPGMPHIQGDPNLPMRCGPQTQKPYTIVSNGGGTATVSTSGFAGAAAQVPASNPVAVARTAPAPAKGYQQVWTDGRINPQRGQVVQAAPRVSTRSTAPAAVRAPAAAATTMTHRYVQVGTFGDPANAARMIQRLGGMGYPVASAKSGNLKIIAAGPFNTPNDLARALQAVRGMGFTDAYTRN